MRVLQNLLVAFALLLAGVIFLAPGSAATESAKTPAASATEPQVAAQASKVASSSSGSHVDFNRDVVPILSNTCYKCHGPDAKDRKAGLRFDVAGAALKPAESGDIPIVPGQPEKSALVRRIFSTDADERMPPPKSNKSLTDAQRQVLKQWIADGAVYKKHWAYVPPQRSATPAALPGQFAGWARNPIDGFILAKLQEQKLRPSVEADRVTLVRRLYFDLIGLPPTPEQVAEFAHDNSPEAYEKLVDRLLASEHYGERMAMYWLDLVRYADSCGYHSDNDRDVYRYRDFVIQAFNSNEHFDRFTIEQLAGDLVPGANDDTRIASGYNRLLQTTEEGGAQPKEYTAKYAADRVRNVSSVWLGSTMACCECHDHKFDPFKTRDFYSMEAFFADVKEAPISRQEETPLPTAVQTAELKHLDEQVAAAHKMLDTQTAALDVAQNHWEKTAAKQKVEWTPLHIVSARAESGATLKVLEDNSVLASGKLPQQETYTLVADTDAVGITGLRLEAMADASLPAHGPGRANNGNFVLSEVTLKAALKSEAAPASSTSPPTKAAQRAATKIALEHASADHSQNGFPIANAIDGKRSTGWAILPQAGATHTAVFETRSPFGDAKGTRLTITLDFNYGDAHSIGRLRLSTTTHAPPLGIKQGLTEAIAEILQIDPAKRSPAQRQTLSTYFRSIAPELHGARIKLAELERKKAALIQSFPRTLITAAVAPRTVRILPRGNWQSDAGDVVTPAVPNFLLPLEVASRRATRLDLAQWLTNRDNPLVARVFVNRLWMLLYGQGIVKTAEDFGSQGAAPSHPELLDWLAVEFMDSGWDVKHLVKLMATSATYRQTSVASDELRQIDPDNRWLARQGRFRLDAELVRDNALAVSGLLSPKIGGPSVKPYQPAGYWAYLNFPTREWANDHGENEYRRGLYTWWQRTFLHPSLQAFDAPTREECTVVRARSNTPLQALVLLNDPTYVEASRVFAVRIMKQGGASPEQRIDWAFRRALSRGATAEEIKVIAKLFAKHRKEYAGDLADAKKLLSDGDTPAPADLDVPELAAWTSVARVILNLHETITRS